MTNSKRGIRLVKFLFILIVLIPSLITGVYFYNFSKDQYMSTFSFSVISENPVNPIDFLSSTSSSPDSHILAEFIRSPRMVGNLERDISLSDVYRKGHFDPLYDLASDASREDLLDLWESLLIAYHDPSSGIIRVEVFAFTAEDAELIANQIIDYSRDLINEISNVSQNDKLEHLRQERAESLESLRASQKEVADFRSKFQVVDPSANLTTQIELIKSLQGKFIDSTIELELMRDILSDTDTRVIQAQRKVDVLEKNIEIERRNIGSLNDSSEFDLVSIFDKYEQLSINVELDRERYSESIRAYAAAISESKIKDKYLAVHIRPERAETSQYPKRELLFFLLVIAYLLAWFCSSLVYYSIRDRA